MKKTSLLLVSGLAAILACAAVPKANAGVVIGVGVGAPVYGYPAPAYGYGYVAPPYVAYGPGHVAPGYVAPYYRRAYVAPIYRDGWRDRDRWHERWEGRRFEGRRDYDGYRR